MKCENQWKNEMSDKAAEATPHKELIAQIMNSNLPKNEREWTAAREIEKLRAEVNNRGECSTCERVKDCYQHVEIFSGGMYQPYFY